MELADRERYSTLIGSPEIAVWKSNRQEKDMKRSSCRRQACGGKGWRTCLRTTEIVQRDVPPALRGVELRLPDTPIVARVVGSGRSRPVLMGDPAIWTDTPKRMRVEILLARNRLEPDGTPRSGAIDCTPSDLRVSL